MDARWTCTCWGLRNTKSITRAIEQEKFRFTREIQLWNDVVTNGFTKFLPGQFDYYAQKEIQPGHRNESSTGDFHVASSMPSDMLGLRIGYAIGGELDALWRCCCAHLGYANLLENLKLQNDREVENIPCLEEQVKTVNLWCCSSRQSNVVCQSTMLKLPMFELVYDVLPMMTAILNVSNRFDVLSWFSLLHFVRPRDKLQLFVDFVILNNKKHYLPENNVCSILIYDYKPVPKMIRFRINFRITHSREPFKNSIY